MRDDNPILIIEHKLLYGSKGVRAESGAVDATREIPEEDYVVPLDTAAVCRPGQDVTVLGWLLMLHYALEAARQMEGEGVSVEVIDVRSLAPLDYDTIGESVRKTGRVVIVEEGPQTGSVSAEIAAGILERFGESCGARFAASRRQTYRFPSRPFWRTPIVPIRHASCRRCAT